MPDYRYESIPESQTGITLYLSHDPDDHSTRKPWSQIKPQPPLQTILRDGLEPNDFSPTPAAYLPVAIPQIVKAAERSPNELLTESLGFCIMSRYSDQIADILKQMKREKIDPTPLHPYHPATSYLDGPKTCCDIVGVLASYIEGSQVRATYVNQHGHTVRDNLMISIIKSHTSTKPVSLDDSLKDVIRFTGEEVDICDCWDADSPCVRHLHANDHPLIPASWKHNFCHG